VLCQKNKQQPFCSKILSTVAIHPPYNKQQHYQQPPLCKKENPKINGYHFSCRKENLEISPPPKKKKEEEQKREQMEG